ncbi:MULTISPECIES: STAS/SEC14 domain-containing protein [Rufibacter]|uniref:STAS/SEC14 domain-containing protein n=1 Tax=Rufibacter TaxID=1379908 RepID=UPI001B3005C4|nr:MULTISPECIES: STAS/SEC14 domain-containing protein [Rufibacter]
MLQQLPSVYYQSNAFTVQYDQNRSLGQSVWQGKMSSEDLKEAFLLCSHVMEKYKLTRWLAHDRNMKAFSEEDTHWIFENIVPSMLAGPLRRMAIIPSEDKEQVASVDFLIERAGDLGDLEVKHFEDENKALDWLMEEF